MRHDAKRPGQCLGLFYGATRDAVPASTRHSADAESSALRRNNMQKGDIFLPIGAWKEIFYNFGARFGLRLRAKDDKLKLSASSFQPSARGKTQMTDAATPADPRVLRSRLRVTKVPMKGSLVAALLFGAVYAATLAVLFMPRDMITSAPASYVPPIMGTTILMPSTLPSLAPDVTPVQAAAATPSPP